MINALELGHMLTTRFKARWIPHRSEWAWMHGERSIRLEYKTTAATGVYDPMVRAMVLTERLLDIETRSGLAKEITLSTYEGTELTSDVCAKWIAIKLIETD